MSDVNTMELDTHPSWTLLTTYAANVIKLKTHHDGNKRFYKAPGPAFISADDAITLLHRITKEVFNG